MYKIVITTQLLFAFLFCVALVATFTEVEKIKEKSRDQITNKVVDMVDSKIDFAEELVKSKKGQTILAEHQVEVIQTEIAEFRENPKTYVDQMIQNETSISSIESSSKNPLTRALLDKVFSWKGEIKNHFNNTFLKLVTDVRIFCLTNILGLIIAAGVLIKRQKFGKHSVAASAILSAVIGVSVLSYLNQSWLFSILLNSYMGIGYPVGILSMFLWIYYDYHSHNKSP